jgi:hypothetical protein
MTQPSPSSTTSDPAAEVRGSTTPRRFTPPLVTGPPGPCGCGCALTPDTSEGFDAVTFATDVLRRPPRPWQRWALIHGLELLPDGRYRFRHILLLVARQNGKTELLVILAAYWMFCIAVPLVLGTSTKIEYAKESWAKMVKMVNATKALSHLHDRKWTRQTNGEQEAWTIDPAAGTGDPESRYKIAASNEEGGRSLTVGRLIQDELRQHHDYSAWDAAVPAGNAVARFQNWCLSNMGDEKSVVLNDQHATMLAFITTGEGDYRKGLMEWSSEPTADPRDVHALAQANPSIGYGLALEDLLGDAVTAMATGGEKLTGFRTEQMCIRVPMLNPAIDPGAWAACAEVGTLAGARSRVAVCLDVAPDGLHATAAAAAQMPGGITRVETVGAWEGASAAADMVRELPSLLGRIRPRVLGWFPGGPGAAVAADLAERGRGWPPPGTEIMPIRGDVPAVCMGFEESTRSDRLRHSDQALLTTQANEAARKDLPEGKWVFERSGEAHVDALYAAAGATHLARTLPTLIPVTMPVGADEVGRGPGTI